MEESKIKWPGMDLKPMTFTIDELANTFNIGCDMQNRNRLIRLWSNKKEQIKKELPVYEINNIDNLTINLINNAENPFIITTKEELIKKNNK